MLVVGWMSRVCHAVDEAWLPIACADMERPACRGEGVVSGLRGARRVPPGLEEPNAMHNEFGMLQYDGAEP